MEHLFVYADGRLREAPLEKKTFIKTDLLSWQGKIRLLLEPLTQQGVPEETAAELFRRKFGCEAYDRFIGPLYGGIYGSDPAEMPAAFALDGLLKREQEIGSFLQAFRKFVEQGQTSPAISFEKGNQQLPIALADAYSDRVKLNTPVTAIRPKDDSAKTGSKQHTTATDSSRRYIVETTCGTEPFDHVFVTTPARVAADILDGVVDNVTALSDLNYNPLAIVHLDAECEREGFGYQVAFGEDLHTLGASWNDSMFDRENLYTLFLGGMNEPDIVDRSEEELGEVATQEFERVMGAPAEVLNVVVRNRSFPAYDHSWYALENFETPSGIDLATNYTARMGIPSRVREARKRVGRLADSH